MIKLSDIQTPLRFDRHCLRSHTEDFDENLLRKKGFLLLWLLILNIKVIWNLVMSKLRTNRCAEMLMSIYGF